METSRRRGDNDAGGRVTIYDVARLAGVSPSTVSRALSRPGRVSVGTLRLVRNAVDELGYTAAPPPAHLDPHTRTIAFSVQRLSNPIYDDIFTGFRQQFPDSYVPVVVESAENAEREAANLTQILPHVDGLVLSSSLLTESQIANIHKQKPTVLVHRQVGGIASVMFDMVEGVNQLMDLVARLGHREVLYISGPEKSWTNGLRWRAIQSAAWERGLRATRSSPFEPGAISGFDAAQAWRESRATTVITFNDLQATGLLHGIDRLGADIPGDVSVASFDNTILAAVAKVPLTSVGGSNFDAGRHAARLLKEQMRRAPQTAPEIVLPMKPYVRKSLGPVAPA